MTVFNEEEQNLLFFYDTGKKESTLAVLNSMKGDLEDDETELRELTESTISKIEKLTDEEYEKIKYVPNWDI